MGFGTPVQQQGFQQSGPTTGTVIYQGQGQQGPVTGYQGQPAPQGAATSSSIDPSIQALILLVLTIVAFWRFAGHADSSKGGFMTAIEKALPWVIGLGAFAWLFNVI